MTTSNSRAAFNDCFDVFDRALAAIAKGNLGVRNDCESPGAANNFRGRMHKARIISRQEMTKVYPNPDDPNHGVSPYDDLIVRVKEAEGKWWVYVEPRRVQGEIQELAAE